MRGLLALLAVLCGAAAISPGIALGQQDYRNKGLSVYTPRPIPAVFGSVPAAQVARHSGAVATADGEAVRSAARRLLSESNPRWLTVRNANTGDAVTVQFWHDGDYDAWEMARIIQLLGDHRDHQEASIDRRLIDLVWILARLSDRDTVVVTSGYRSVHTNLHLASINSNVASDSLHMSGRALDIAIPGVSTDVIAQRAVGLSWGGVGEYRADGHVHVDVGPVRYWRQ